MQNKKTIIVSAGIIQKNKLTLIAQRKKTSDEPDLWEFPGGKLEFQETPEECLIREIKEELNINIKIKSLYTIKSILKEKNKILTQIILIVFIAKYESGELKKLDCQNYAWIKKEDLKKYKFSKADEQIAHQYFNT